jgi:hypothetical protein
MMKREEERRRSQQVSAPLMIMQSHDVAPLTIISSMLLQASRPFSSSSCRPLKCYHHSISIFLLLSKRTLNPSSTTPSHTTYLTILHRLLTMLQASTAKRKRVARAGQRMTSSISQTKKRRLLLRESQARLGHTCVCV